MKSVMISIKPKWCELIALGKKTIEIRKTRPKMETPFKVYIYQTLSKHGKHNDKGGKVIGEFVCDGIEDFVTEHISELACVKMSEIMEYGGYSRHLFCWHISDLKIYDKPKELLDFYVWKKCNSCRDTGYESTACCYDEDCKVPAMITRPPQSWCYVESLQDEVAEG